MPVLEDGKRRGEGISVRPRPRERVRPRACAMRTRGHRRQARSNTSVQHSGMRGPAWHAMRYHGTGVPWPAHSPTSASYLGAGARPARSLAAAGARPARSLAAAGARPARSLAAAGARPARRAGAAAARAPAAPAAGTPAAGPAHLAQPPLARRAPGTPGAGSPGAPPARAPRRWRRRRRARRPARRPPAAPAQPSSRGAARRHASSPPPAGGTLGRPPRPQALARPTSAPGRPATRCQRPRALLERKILRMCKGTSAVSAPSRRHARHCPHACACALANGFQAPSHPPGGSLGPHDARRAPHGTHLEHTRDAPFLQPPRGRPYVRCELRFPPPPPTKRAGCSPRRRGWRPPVRPPRRRAARRARSRSE